MGRRSRKSRERRVDFSALANKEAFAERKRRRLAWEASPAGKRNKEWRESDAFDSIRSVLWTAIMLQIEAKADAPFAPWPGGVYIGRMEKKDDAGFYASSMIHQYFNESDARKIKACADENNVKMKSWKTAESSTPTA